MERDIDLSSLLQRAAGMTDADTFSADETAALDAALSHAPYFSVAAVLLLRHGTISPERRKELQQRLSLTASDRRTLAYAELGDERALFYPAAEAAPAPDTTDVIDTFLRTYGSCTPEEERQLERMIFNPTPDYAELLARQEQAELPPDDAPAGSQDALINAFIRSQHDAPHFTMHPGPEPDEPDEPELPVSKPEPADDSLLSESLAMIFVKQHRYERAYEIISGLSLKFPKKSAYFADQLRFLQKLIINQRCLDSKNSSASEK